MAAEDGPLVVYVLSGKRKSGKDFVAAKLFDAFGEDLCVIIRLSEPLKYEYACLHGLRFDELLESSAYKERYRTDMIRWGEEKRNADPLYFCRLATELPLLGQGRNRSDYTVKKNHKRNVKQVWIVSDARRKTDLRYFEERYNVISVRINACEEVRAGRGWIFTSGVDDVQSECALDDATFDVQLQNDGDDANFQNAIKSLVDEGSGFLNKARGFNC